MPATNEAAGMGERTPGGEGPGGEGKDLAGAVRRCAAGLALVVGFLAAVGSALAEEAAGQSPVFAGPEVLSFLPQQADATAAPGLPSALSDAELSAVQGLGAEGTALETPDTLAVILWDEPGRGGRNGGTTGYTQSSGNHNVQTNTMVINR